MTTINIVCLNYTVQVYATKYVSTLHSGVCLYYTVYAYTKYLLSTHYMSTSQCLSTQGRFPEMYTVTKIKHKIFFLVY